MVYLWQGSYVADPAVARLADSHYSRKTPGSRQFAPPGKKLVLYVAGPEWPFRAWAGWVWWQGKKIRESEWNGWFHNTLFRNESPYLSSDLIREAVIIARNCWGDPPNGFDTYVDVNKIRSSNPGYCYQQAGWHKGELSKTRRKLRLYLPTAELE